MSGAEYVTVKEVARRLRVSNMTVYRMVEAGELPSIRVGRSIRIPRDAADRLLTQGTIEQKGAGEALNPNSAHSLVANPTQGRQAGTGTARSASGPMVAAGQVTQTAEKDAPVTHCAEHGSLPERFRYKACPWCPRVLVEEIR